MKHFRILDGAVHNLDAERCEVTPRAVIFSLSKIMIKTYDLAHVTLVEELDDGLHPKKVIFRMDPSLAATNGK